MKALVEAVANSIESEVADASEWTIETTDRMWRNPKDGKNLNVYAERRFDAGARWTGGTVDAVEVTLEFGVPAASKQRRLERDEVATFEADDVADQIADWAAAHEAGFSPAHKMDFVEANYSPRVRPELFVRYVRCLVRFEVVRSFT